MIAYQEHVERALLTPVAVKQLIVRAKRTCRGEETSRILGHLLRELETVSMLWAHAKAEVIYP